MGARKAGRVASRLVPGRGFARRVPGDCGDVLAEITRAHFSTGSATRDTLQRRGRSAALRFLLPGGGPAWRVSDRHFHRRAEPGAGAAVAEAIAARVRPRVRRLGEAFGKVARTDSQQESESGDEAQTPAPLGRRRCDDAFPAAGVDVEEAL